MSRPDLNAVLSSLKGFQRDTVEHAFNRLFVAPDSTHRFLVADEVGLGKTLVARGIIAKTIDHLWDSVPRIDILYICSNGSIARQNLTKLHVSGANENSLALATRLTLLATQLGPTDGGPDLADSKLNFVSFTPRTSFNMGHSSGRSDERVVLFQLLFPSVGRWTALANLLQGRVQNADNWRSRLRSWYGKIEPGIAASFRQAFEADEALHADLTALLDGPFARIRPAWAADLRSRRNRVIGRLRRLLASCCIQALEPDLVIMDEFQRFKGLLETRKDKQDSAAELAQALFDATTPEGQPVRTLLLSATPYKLYTADAEIEQDDHYADFLDTTRFLLGNDEVSVIKLQQDLSRFGAALKRAASGGVDAVAGPRADVEHALTRVMARTERVRDTATRDAMVYEPHVSMQIHTSDVRQYMAADALFQAVGDRDPMPFWKAAPYLPHFMKGYRFNDNFTATATTSPDKLLAVFERHHDAQLDQAALERFQTLDPSHAKLRELVQDVVGGGQWKLLWMPPSTTYWPLEGAYEGQDTQTKALIFSAWNVVPDVVTAVVSYEAERLMAGDKLTSYHRPADQQGPLLRLSLHQDGRRAAHRNLLILLPCLTLSDQAHPLTAPPGADRRVHVRAIVRDLLTTLPDPAGDTADKRWEYALPLLLDPGMRDTLLAWRANVKNSWNPPNSESFGDYVSDLLALDAHELGPRPPDLEDLATALALSSPAVLAARTMAPAGLPDATRRYLAVQVAQAFWSLFNRPSVITLLRQLKHADTPYWRATLTYCEHGNLQAVLDECWHHLWEQHAWADDLDVEKIANACAAQLAASIIPQRASVDATFYSATPEGAVEIDRLRIRMSIAQRFGEARTDDGRKVTQDAVRGAFNSPFRPFVLASTTVGQEGLDFHFWCHRLIHWNLPGNPVDLEQREGRVHRFKGHAVRRNVAHAHAAAALARWVPGQDPWALIFEDANAAARAEGASDLVPFWLANGPFKVIRHVPLLPFTKEVEAFARLKRQLAAYRVVFGQARQEELLRLLDVAGVEEEVLRGWVVDLRPPPRA